MKFQSERTRGIAGLESSRYSLEMGNDGVITFLMDFVVCVQSGSDMLWRHCYEHHNAFAKYHLVPKNLITEVRTSSMVGTE